MSFVVLHTAEDGGNQCQPDQQDSAGNYASVLLSEQIEKGGQREVGVIFGGPIVGE